MKKYYVFRLNSDGKVSPMEGHDKYGLAVSSGHDTMDEAGKQADDLARAGSIAIIMQPVATVKVKTETEIVRLTQTEPAP